MNDLVAQDFDDSYGAVGEVTADAARTYAGLDPHPPLGEFIIRTHSRDPLPVGRCAGHRRRAGHRPCQSCPGEY